MIKQFEAILNTLLSFQKKADCLPIFDPVYQFNPDDRSETGVLRSLNAAFLVTLCGRNHPLFDRAEQWLEELKSSPEWGEIAEFYRQGKQEVLEEIRRVSEQDETFRRNLQNLSDWLQNIPADTGPEELAEKVWSLFFPEGVGIRGKEQEQIDALRETRRVKLTRLNNQPLNHPAREILFTSNVLLTLPIPLQSIDDLPLSRELKINLQKVRQEPQRYWYDHPVPIGVPPENNEVIYGLRGLDEALEFEIERGNFSPEEKATCLLSVSVTHRGLHQVAPDYLRQEFRKAGGFKHLRVFLFTENETDKLLKEVLLPAAKHFLKKSVNELPTVFGVDGEYGRHYSFLKAIAALWKILIDPEIRATFKIDLDQVFPQQELVGETGASALEHFRTPLWGAEGTDSSGQPVELGMIAGALVNEKDIAQSLFTPDVPFPGGNLSPDEYIFFSALPQALSTRAEMMVRYDNPALDGKTTCLQRVHVTGGTNGILIDALRRHRPFTPTFMGRAEDQAYILSVLFDKGKRLAYLHKDGLIMRHDKAAFARQAMEHAYIGKLIGDYVRILYFSEYARVLSGDIRQIKALIDPFTGCFVSRIPFTVVFLRFALRAASFFAVGDDKHGRDFITIGSKRIRRALEFVRGENSPLKRQYRREQRGWSLYYDVLTELEKALAGNDPFAGELRERARKIVAGCEIRPEHIK